MTTTKKLHWWANPGGLSFEKAGDAEREIWKPIELFFRAHTNKSTLHTKKRHSLLTLKDTLTAKL